MSRFAIAALLACACAGSAYADGAHIALRGSSGAYSITLFTAPDPLVSGPVDLSLLVEDAATGEVLGDATATGTLSCACAQPVSFELTHGAASNKLLLAAMPALPAAGSYTLVLAVKEPGRPGRSDASFTTVLAVAEDHRRRTTLLFGLGVPVTVILLFLVNQQAKARRQLYTR